MHLPIYKDFTGTSPGGVNMKVFIEKENKQVVLDKEYTAKELLVELNINATTVILVKNNETILLDEKLSEDDEIKILSVVSGG